MKAASTEMLRVGTVEELKSQQCIVVRGADHPIAVYYNDGHIKAVDNRCPHMGFPLSKGSVHDGILTCHWHHARFDLASGCTFDLFADDVPAAKVEVRNGIVFVAKRTSVADPHAHDQRRLKEGLAQNIDLITAKSIIAILREGGEGGGCRDIVRTAAVFGSRNRDGWSSGMTIMTALANLIPLLPPLPDEEQFLALYQGLSHVANDCAGQTPRRDRYPLEGSDVPFDTLKKWLRDWTRVRHRDGAERTLLTAIQNGATQNQLAEMLLTAASDRAYADGGHTLDFINKSFELLDLIGWHHANTIVPMVVRGLVVSRGGEESSAWRHPIDLVQLIDNAVAKTAPTPKQNLQDGLLTDDPQTVVQVLSSAIQSQPASDVTKQLALAAATRIARFGTANEFGDWITALHTFTYCNALHQSVKRLTRDSAKLPMEIYRAIYHGAISIYLDRFLNIPPAPLPGERTSTPSDLPTDAPGLLQRFLDTLNTQQRVTAAAEVIARYLDLKLPIEPLFATMARSVLREDAEFHTYQMLEASIQQFKEWGNTPEGRLILIAFARYAAAHSPTQRAALQTATIALKLDRSEPLYEE